MEPTGKTRISGWARKPPGGLAGTVFWITIAFVVLSLGRLLPGAPGGPLVVLQALTGVALLVAAVPLGWRFVRRRLLWSLRNKLILTYLLIGLAPVVLFVTLVMITAYVAAGQFAIHLADSRLQGELGHLGGENANTLDRLTRVPLSSDPAADAETAGSEIDDGATSSRPVTRSRYRVFLDGRALGPGIQADHARTPLGLPPWALRLPEERFRGMVLDGDDLYLVTIHQRKTSDAHRLTVLSSLAVDEPLMATIGSGLGRAGLVPLLAGGHRPGERYGGAVGSDAPRSAQPTAAAPAPRPTSARRVNREEVRRATGVFGGEQPPPSSLLDLSVRFPSTLPVVDWDTGDVGDIPIEVYSRPSLLYRQLFGASLTGIVANVIRIGLVVLCVLFACIEALALVMALRLSRTMTTSVTDLYQATQHVDRGNFEHRIGVKRDDQLAELSRSFNQMIGSLQRLLKEQKEKERLQNEISIAQEVQANLFPHRVHGLPTLDLHGVCRPARSVSGDYYDFLVFHEKAHDGRPNRKETGMGLALGDISGKGISAALLMATLHSAVRAYRFASEELVFTESSVAGLTSSREQEGGCDELFQSPGRILSLLNRHLYRSTQPEKYATLFLAHFDAASRRLTYSNAGQLPPLVLGRDGTVRRLDCGGTVVGLIDGMHYEEDSFSMRPGDLMIAYSDGVTEPENDFGEFGEERLLDVVRRYRDFPLHEISAQVMQALDAWIGAEEQPDDITLVLARAI